MTNYKALELQADVQNVQGFLLNLDLSRIESELEKLREIKFSDKVISNGIFFIPIVKQNISKLIQIMEAKNVNLSSLFIHSSFTVYI